MKWTDGTGLTGQPGLVCRTCSDLNRKEDPKSTSSTDKSSSDEESLKIVSEPNNATPGVPLNKVSHINFGSHGPPLHLCFVMNSATIIQQGGGP
jgi:hypothetical protein